jgi:flagellum-specific ATP synthase
VEALERLEHAVIGAVDALQKVQISGVVTEVTPASGLSQFLKLGDAVSLAGENRLQIGEVVRINATGATVKPFDAKIGTGLGAPAFKIGPLRLAPDPSWKGRVINALAGAIDGGSPLIAGERIVPIDAEPPPSMRRARVRKPLVTGIRVIDFFAPLCAG